jgi:hypothetical protein
MMPDGKLVLVLRPSEALSEKLMAAALGRNTSPARLAKEIVETVINDDLIAAVLDK